MPKDLSDIKFKLETISYSLTKIFEQIDGKMNLGSPEREALIYLTDVVTTLADIIEDHCIASRLVGYKKIIRP